jgi:hypothetical protein
VSENTADVLGFDPVPDETTGINAESEPADNKEELEKLLQETNPPVTEEIVAPVVSINQLKAERLAALVAPVHEISKHTKILMYGAQGTSKTTTSMHAGNLNPLLIAIEHGEKSLLNHDATQHAKVMPFKSVQQIEDIAEVTTLGLFGDEYGVYVLDTFSELNKVGLSDRVREMYTPGRDRYKPEGFDYTSNGEHMRQIAAAFRDVPKNVIFVCQEVYKDGIYMPDLPAKVYQKLGEYCDLICRMTGTLDEEGNPHFYMQTRRTPEVEAKCRIKLLPTHIEGASFDLIHRANMKQINDAKEKQS